MKAKIELYLNDDGRVSYEVDGGDFELESLIHTFARIEGMGDIAVNAVMQYVVDKANESENRLLNPNAN